MGWRGLSEAWPRYNRATSLRSLDPATRRTYLLPLTSPLNLEPRTLNPPYTLTTRFPLTRRISRRTSSALSVESTRGTASWLATTT